MLPRLPGSRTGREGHVHYTLIPTSQWFSYVLSPFMPSAHQRPQRPLLRGPPSSVTAARRRLGARLPPVVPLLPTAPSPPAFPWVSPAAETVVASARAGRPDRGRGEGERNGGGEANAASRLLDSGDKAHRLLIGAGKWREFCLNKLRPVVPRHIEERGALHSDVQVVRRRGLCSKATSAGMSLSCSSDLAIEIQKDPRVWALREVTPHVNQTPSRSRLAVRKDQLEIQQTPGR